MIRPWEEISFNKDRHGLGYNKENTLFVPNFSKQFHFVSVGFLDSDQNMVKCYHCKQNGHMESKFFDLHPCHHCGKKNHSFEKCCKKNQPPRVKIKYAWIDPWKW